MIFKSKDDQKVLVQILKSINPLTVAVYGPALDLWSTLGSNRDALIQILKTINTSTVLVYGPPLMRGADSRSTGMHSRRF